MEILHAIGTGKSTSFMLMTMYKTYVDIIVDSLLKMKRIPRKMKKRYKKNKDIWNRFKEV